jgi:hypothetical protein
MLLDRCIHDDRSRNAMAAAEIEDLADEFLPAQVQPFGRHPAAGVDHCIGLEPFAAG